MSRGIRKPPRPPARKRAPVKKPLHQRILGKAQAKLDILDDLEAELESAYKLDLMEYDVYLDCWEALELRREKAEQAKSRALGRPKPDKVVPVYVRPVRRRRKPIRRWQKKLIFLVVLLVLYKIFA